ncbi:MAG: hypothetical protein JWL68_2359 [Actinomycetia bacterium]|nr:hypothetical protein [Actinomycetes bacterium]
MMRSVARWQSMDPELTTLWVCEKEFDMDLTRS